MGNQVRRASSPSRMSAFAVRSAAPTATSGRLGRAPRQQHGGERAGEHDRGHGPACTAAPATGTRTARPPPWPTWTTWPAVRSHTTARMPRPTSPDVPAVAHRAVDVAEHPAGQRRVQEHATGSSGRPPRPTAAARRGPGDQAPPPGAAHGGQRADAERGRERPTVDQPQPVEERAGCPAATAGRRGWPPRRAGAPRPRPTASRGRCRLRAPGQVVPTAPVRVRCSNVSPPRKNVLLADTHGRRSAGSFARSGEECPR